MDPYILALMADKEIEEIFAEDVEMEDVDGKFSFVNCLLSISNIYRCVKQLSSVKTIRHHKMFSLVFVIDHGAKGLFSSMTRKSLK